MWIYEKKLEFPVKITQPDARLAKIMMLLACALAFGLSACGKGEQMSEMEAIQKQLMEMEGYSCTAELTRTSNKGQNTYGTKQYYKSTGEYRMELTSPESAAGNYTVFYGQQVCQYNTPCWKQSYRAAIHRFPQKSCG